MRRNDPQSWMLSEALAALTRAERLRRQFFEIRQVEQQPAWEPPVDVLELEQEVLILIALPGVDLEQVEAVIEDGALIVRGQRLLPPELRRAAIHRMELPQGRFERLVPLPAGHYAGVRRSAANGCLVVNLLKTP